MIQRTVHGIQLQQFCRIGGRLSVPRNLQIIAHVQVDGSYSSTTREARAAAILTPTKSHNTYRHVQGISAESSTETKWAAISLGLEFAMTHNEEVIAIENDCLSVVGALLMRDGPLRHEYARYWRNRIIGSANQCQWVGLRWIPRQMNHADDLFSANR